MSGSTPYAARSPTQSNPYPPYSPTHPNRPFYNHEYQQIPPPPPASHVMQTPPPFAPASLAHSPHHGRSLASPIVAPNSSLPPPPPGSSVAYSQVTSSPPYGLQRTYSGHLVQTAMPPPYEGTPSSHAHPHSRQGSIIQSPVREHYPLQNGFPRDQPQSNSRPQSKDVRNTFDF